MLRTLVSLQVLALDAGHRLRQRLSDDRGQSTAEYALVLLGAAAIALLLLAWATETGAVGRLLDAVLRNILDRV